LFVIAGMKSPSYKKVGILLQQGHIHDFEEIASDIQKKTVARDMRMHVRTLGSRIKDPGKWTIGELAALSNLLEIDHKILLELADRLNTPGKKKGKKL